MGFYLLIGLLVIIHEPTIPALLLVTTLPLFIDFQVEGSKLVAEFISDPQRADEKYLGMGSETKVLEVTGTVASIKEDFNHQKVVLLKLASDKAGVNSAFLESNNSQVDEAMEGKEITVKGVIRSGASYDEDFEMYEHVILEKCALIGK